MIRSPLECRPMLVPGVNDPSFASGGDPSAKRPGRAVEHPDDRIDSEATRHVRRGSPGNSTHAFSRRSGSPGFTITELMVVLVLGMIMVAIGARFMGNWYDQYRFSGLVRSFQTTVKAARGYAITRQARCTLIIKLLTPDQLLTDPVLQTWRDVGVNAPGYNSSPYFFLNHKLGLNSLGKPAPVYEDNLWFYCDPDFFDIQVPDDKISFNSRGFSVSENPPHSGNYKLATYTVVIRSKDGKRDVSFTITSLGKIKQGDST